MTVERPVKLVSTLVVMTFNQNLKLKIKHNIEKIEMLNIFTGFKGKGGWVELYMQLHPRGEF